jgi:hypothetical protein
MTSPLMLAPRSVATVIATAWIFTGQSFVWPGSIAFAVISTTLCLGILFSPFTRACCFGLAALIAATIFTHPTWFAHNRVFVAALLFMISVTADRFTFLIRWQVAFVFFVAALDKLGQPAWRDGRFFESFIAQLAHFGLMWSPAGTVGAPNTIATFLEHAGNQQMWMLVGLGAIAVELFLAGCFFFNSRSGAALNAAFHLIVYAVTGSTMGQFFFAGLACSLLLVEEKDLPSAPVLIVGTAALAGPWTHRLLPLVLLLVWRLARRR